jgi:Ca2+-binding EF-hand superfamily protein
VFDEFDTDHSGSLDTEELRQLIKRVLPRCKPEQAEHCVMLMDLDGDGQITFDEFEKSMAIMKGARAELTAAYDKGEISDPLKRVASHLVSPENTGAAATLFKTFATAPGGQGKLTQQLLVSKLKAYVTELSQDEILHLLMAISLEMGLEGGVPLVAAEDLKARLRLVNLTVLSLEQQAVTNNTGGPPITRVQWTLCPVHHDGHTYLLDKSTNKVFAEPAAAGACPVAVGRMAGEDIATGVVSLYAPRPDLVALLKEGLRSAGRLRSLFNQHDDDGSGLLGSDEVGRFLTAALPAAMPAHRRMLRDLIHLEGHGHADLDAAVHVLRSTAAEVGGVAPPSL